MTREQRIEAAARAMQHRDEFSHLGSTPFDDEPEGVQDEWRVQAAWALKHAFPEIMSDPPTGWVAPMEPTMAMLDAAEDRFEDFKDQGFSSDGDGNRYEYTDIRSGFAYGMYEAARDAYTKEQT